MHKNRLRWLVVSLAVLILSAGSVLVCATVQQGYPNAVYYQEIASTIAGQLPPRRSTITVVQYTAGTVAYSSHTETTPPVDSIWFDPEQGVMREQAGDAALLTPIIIRHGMLFFTGRDSHTYPSKLSSQEQRAHLREFQALREGGFGAWGTYYLQHAVGQVGRVTLFGHPALRCVVAGPDLPVSRLVVWLDPSTHVPLQEQFKDADGRLRTERFLTEVRLAPGSLPPDFFDLPQHHVSLWHSVLTWARSKV